MEPSKEAMIAQLHLWALSQGAELCDRCGDTIWPEIELVRCDFCVGKHGAPDTALVREAEKRCGQRIAKYEREMLEEYIQGAGSDDL